MAISAEDARWLALFLDTEGNIVIKRARLASGRTTYGTQIVFSSTHRGLLECAQTIIGRGTILERGGTNAPMRYLQMSNQQAATLLRCLYSFLIVKQRQARLGIWLQLLLSASEAERRAKPSRLRGRTRSDHYTACLERIWLTMKSLNHFGDPDLSSWVPDPEQLGLVV
jgi:hypothetical protein